MRREQHDALDPEVHHPGALGQELAQGGEDERGRDADQRREESDLQQLGEKIMHGAGHACRGLATRRRYWVKSRAVSMASSETPWITSARNTGTPVARDMPSAPVIMAA